MLPVALKKLYQIWEKKKAKPWWCHQGHVHGVASPPSGKPLQPHLARFFFFSLPCAALAVAQCLALHWHEHSAENRISTGQTAGDIVRVSSWSSTLLGVDWAHSLSSLKDCLLVKSTPSNLISRLPQSETAYKAAPAARKAPLASWTKQVVITFSWMSSQGQCREDLNVNYYLRLLNFHNFFLSVGN